MGFGSKLRAQLVDGDVVKARQSAGTVAGGRVTRSGKDDASRQERPLVGGGKVTRSLRFHAPAPETTLPIVIAAAGLNPAGVGAASLLRHPGLAQAGEDVFDGRLVLIQLESGSERRKFRVELSQIGQRGSRVLNPIELGKPGNDVCQRRYVITVQGPRPSSDLNGLRIMT
jgi:hypothetical protein